MKERIKRIGDSLLILAALFALFFAAGGRQVSAKAIKLNKTTVYMAKGDSCQLKVTGTKKKVTWKTSNKKIVTVSSKGLLKAKKIGKATITAKVAGKKLTCKVVVEKKAVNRARKLRDYVISKGTYDKKTKSWQLKKNSTQNDYAHITALITAYKKDTKLKFEYVFDYGDPAIVDHITMTIDLISGKAAKKTGSLYCTKTNNDIPERWIYEGNVTTAYNGSGKGISLLRVINEENLTNEVPDVLVHENPDTMGDYIPSADSLVREAFKGFNKYFTSKKALNGITMTSIGFSSYK